MTPNQKNPYSSRRSPVLARNIASTSQPLAASAVSREKERRTFVLLLLTDLSAFEIVFGKLNTYLLVAIPLFTLMAQFMIRGRVVDDLYATAHTLLRHLPGGLGVATVAAALDALGDPTRRELYERILARPSRIGALGETSADTSRHWERVKRRASSIRSGSSSPH